MARAETECEDWKTKAESKEQSGLLLLLRQSFQIACMIRKPQRSDPE
jgi:hypothetical protein